VAGPLAVDVEGVSAGALVGAMAAGAGFRAVSAIFAETGTCGMREALGDGLSAPAAPIARAVVEDAS
jgi:hypothetical protein